MQNLKYWLLSAALAIFLPLSALAAKPIVILHTNDVHCGIDNNLSLDKVAQYKAVLEQQGQNVLLVDAGDFVQGEALGTLSEGEALVRLMNKADFDFAVPGNHEFDYGMEQFNELDALSDAGYYSCNIWHKEKDKLLLEPYKIFDFGDTKVALIGVTTPETLTASTPVFFQNNKGRYIYDFYEDLTGKRLYRQIQKTVNQVRRAGADKVFLVAHLGMNSGQRQWSSKAVAQNTYGIDGIIDGHSHEQYAGVVVQNKKGADVLLAQTGTKLAKLGKLTIDAEGRLKHELLDDLSGFSIPVAASIALEQNAFTEQLEGAVGKSDYMLYDKDPITMKRLVRRQENSVGNFIADAARTVFAADIGIVNGGALRASLPEGVIRYKDVIKVLPFAGSFVCKEVSGQQLLDALELGCSSYPQETGGFLNVSGLKFTLDSSIPSSVQVDVKGNFIKVAGEYRVKNVQVGNQPLDLKKKYTVAGLAYTLCDGGDGMVMFNKAKLARPQKIADTDLVCQYLTEFLKGKIGKQYSNPYGEGRIIIE